MKTIAEQLNIKEFPFRIYDSNGNIIYYENSDGYWYKREYDSNRNETYHENADGYWWKTEYDSSGNETYYEDSYGFWWKGEYDPNGNEVYYENSYGAVIDNRQKQSCEGKIVEIDGVEYELKIKK